MVPLPKPGPSPPPPPVPFEPPPRPPISTRSWSCPLRTRSSISGSCGPPSGGRRPPPLLGPRSSPPPPELPPPPHGPPEFPAIRLSSLIALPLTALLCTCAAQAKNQAAQTGVFIVTSSSDMVGCTATV